VVEQVAGRPALDALAAVVGGERSAGNADAAITRGVAIGRSVASNAVALPMTASLPRADVAAVPET